MLMRRTLGAVAILLALGTFALTQTPANKDAERIDALIKQLGGRKSSEREKATRELEAIGATALEALKKAAKEADLETSRRAEAIVKRLEEKISTASLLAPKLVRLNVKEMSVLSAVDELAKISGYPIQVQGDRTVVADKKVTLDTGEVSFWEALDQLCEKTGLQESGGVPVNVHNMPPGLRVRPPIRIAPPRVLPAPAIPVPPPAQALPALPLIQPFNPNQPAPPPVQIQLPGAAPAPAPQPIPIPIQAVPIQAQAVEVVAFQAAEAPPQAAKPLVGGGGQAGAPAAAGKAQAVPAQVQAQPVPVQIAPAPPVQVWMDSPMPHGRPMAPNGVVILTPGKGVPQLTSYAGAVRVRVSPILKKEGQPDQGALQFMLDAAAEPRLQGFRIIGAPTIEKALDDQGQSLAAAMAPMDPNGQDPAVGGGIAIGGRGVVVINGNVVINGMSTMPGMPGQKQQALVRLKPGEKQAKKLKELKGNLTAEVIIPNETLITVDNVMKAAGETVKGKNGGAITIQSIEKTGNGDYKVKINMETPPGGNNPFGGMFGGGAVMIQNVQIQVGGGGFGGGFPGSGPIQGSGLPELVDAKGNKLPLVQIPSRSMNVNNGQMTQEVVLVFRASKDQGEPVRMVLFGNRTTTVQVPFAFQNVPME